MTEGDFLNGQNTFPLMFYPEKQTNQVRANKQAPIYIAQMDFRYDLADIWADYEMRKKNKVFVKFHLSHTIKNGLAKYLEQKGIREEVVYPH
jgi:hypothetical protein